MSAQPLRCTRFPHRPGLGRQRGMGATIILFTIALIVLVGAALAYASRGNPSAANVQGGKVYASVLLKQSADYHDAYSRFIFDGGNAANMTFNITPATANELFNPSTQYGTYQAPPPQSVIPPAVATWLYKNNAKVPGVGSGGPGSMIFVANVTQEACTETNQQLYGVRSIPTSATTVASLTGTGAVTLDVSLNGRATGCFVNTEATNVFYVTLNEG